MKIVEIDPDNELLLYHGSQKDIDSFSSGLVYLTPEEEEAAAFSQNVHRPGASASASYLYTVAAKPGKTLDIDQELAERMNDGEDADEIIAEKATLAKRSGYKYLSFYHPGIHTDEFLVFVSLFPNRDLEIVDKN